MKDLSHYLLLAAALSLGLVFFLFFDFNRQAQTGIMLMMAAVYVLWGVIHHAVKKDLHWRVVVEYVVLSMMASVVVIFLLWRT